MEYIISYEPEKFEYSDIYTPVEDNTVCINSKESILFAENTYEDNTFSVLGAEMENTLLELTNLMHACPNVVLEVRSYTFDLGNEEFEISVSSSIANLIKQHLVQERIEDDRIVTYAFGSTDFTENASKISMGFSTSKTRSINRQKVEFRVFSK